MLRRYRFSSVPIALASFIITASLLLSVSCTTLGGNRGGAPADSEESSEQTAEQTEEHTSDLLREEMNAEESSQKPAAASSAGFIDPPAELAEKFPELEVEVPETEIPLPDVPEITPPVYPVSPEKTERTLTKEFPEASHAPGLPPLPAAPEESGDRESAAQRPQGDRESAAQRQEQQEAAREEAAREEGRAAQRQEQQEAGREEAAREEAAREEVSGRPEPEPPAAPPEEEKPREEDPSGRQEEKARVQRVEPEIPSERKSVWAAPGDTVELFLKERGWVYDQGSSSAEGVDFRERSYKEESTEFVFRVQRTGSFQLTFFRENMSTGEREQQIVDIISTLSGEMPEGLSTSPAGPAGEQGEEGEPPSRKEIREAVERGDSDYLARNIEGLTVLASEDREPDSLSLAIEAAQTLLDNGRQREARNILQRGLENAAASEDEREALYFYLGRLYESRGPLRDEHRAAGYYQKVIESFPAGIYWSDAKERKRFLERHYLQVR